MADVADRQSLIEQLVALHGGKASARRRYERFDDAALVKALADVEATARDIAQRGSRLAAVWAEDGTVLSESETPGRTAA